MRKKQIKLLPYCKIEMTCIAATEIFGGYVKDTKRTWRKSSFTRIFPDMRTLDISFKKFPDGFHLLFLEGIVAMAQIGGTWLDDNSEWNKGQRLRRKLNTAEAAVGSPVLILQTTLEELAAQMGRAPDSSTIRQMISALADLANIRTGWLDREENLIEASNLLSYAPAKPEKGKPLAICLSPFLSNIGTDRPFVDINMDEVRKLKKTSSIILHAWLSSVIPPGATKRIRNGLLIERVIWRDPEEITHAIWKARKRILVNKIYPDLEQAGWKIKVDGGYTYFTRPYSTVTILTVPPSYQPYPEYVVTENGLLPGRAL